MTIIEKIDKSYTEVLDEGIIPCLVVINSNDVLNLLTTEIKTENKTAEDWFLDNYNAEVLTTDLKTDPNFYGKYANKDEEE